MQKTKSIDFATLTLRDAIDLAMLVEQEAKERYGELADQMQIHHNPDVEKFFRFMLNVESLHEVKLAERRKKLYGDAPATVRREMIFDVEAPEYDEARATMTVRQALEASLRAERKAWAFFDESLGGVKDAGVRALFEELRAEEKEHEGLVLKEIAKLPAEEASPIDADDVDDGPVGL